MGGIEITKLSIAYDVIRWEEKSILEAAKKKGVEINPIECKRRFFDLDERLDKEFGEIILQRCVSYYRNLHLTGLFEMKGSRVINRLEDSIICGNKLFTALTLKAGGVKTPKAVFSTNIEGALKSIEKTGYPSILKPTVGSWGKLMALLKDESAAEEFIEHRENMHPSYQQYYIEEKVKRPPRDIRSFVIGDKVIAAIYREAAPGVWRTNTARGGKASNCPITKELEEISLKAVSTIGEGIYGVDCMETEEGLIVHEINSTTEFRNSVPVTGIDIPGLIVDYLVKLSKE